jgi:hypothetical protein
MEVTFKQSSAKIQISYRYNPGAAIYIRNDADVQPIQNFCIAKS